MAPLLVQSPRLVTALTAWFATQLDWHDLYWPTTRLLLLAAREERDRGALPAHSLGRLPAEVVGGRILSFLRPPRILQEAAAEASLRVSPECPNDTEEAKKDIIAVLVHLIVFSPHAVWPQLSAFAFSLVEAALGGLDHEIQERQMHMLLAASVLTAIAQRMEAKIGVVEEKDLRQHRLQDMGPLIRFTAILKSIVEEHCHSSTLSSFLDCRIKVAIEHVRRVQESFQCFLEGPMPT